MHTYHEGLPGYSPAQLLHDGCPECVARGQSRGLGIGQLDHRNFARAWQRAADWNRDGLPDVSMAERPMLDALWAIQIHLERRGVPIGTVPDGVQ
jgi:hypothetical protein